MIEQWERAPEQSEKDRSRSQASFEFVHYGDSLSVQAGALVDLSAFEISLKASQRFYLDLTDEGKFLEEALSDERQTAGVGIARHFITQDGHFGRLGLNYFHSFPGARNWIQLSLTGGKIASEAVPWFITLQTSLFVSLPHSSNYVSVRGTSGRTYRLNEKSAFEVGGFLWWTYRLRDLSLPAGVPDLVFEHMLFSLGPTLAYRSPAGILRADLLFRLWLDEEVMHTPTNNLTGYPSEVGPSLQVSWTMFF